ncbi:response regulator [Marinobacter mobilis]|uniref:response regulator n=1 Tax=Marinobacter mobilis TaxID=488533 RepID=UPI0035C74E7A
MSLTTMSLRILICDDSSLARKQMARALPDTLDAEISFAENGRSALSLLRGNEWDLLFLDLNMPELDGYGVLEAIQQEDLPVMTVVVSADIQPQARERVTKLGALAFIRKPTDPERIADLLNDYGIYRPTDAASARLTAPLHRDEAAPSRPGFHAAIQELANVAMGQASDLLARLLNAFVKLPVPKVDRLARSELYMAIAAADEKDKYSGVCQGFTGAGIAGEALLLFSDAQLKDMSALVGYGSEDETAAVEALMDLSGMLFGAFINSFGEQLNLTFGLAHPTLLGQHQKISDLLRYHRSQPEELLCIEIRYEIEGRNVSCDLLIVLTERSLQHLEQHLHYLMD